MRLGLVGYGSIAEYHVEAPQCHWPRGPAAGSTSGGRAAATEIGVAKHRRQAARADGGVRSPLRHRATFDRPGTRPLDDPGTSTPLVVHLPDRPAFRASSEKCLLAGKHRPRGDSADERASRRRHGWRALAKSRSSADGLHTQRYYPAFIEARR